MAGASDCNVIWVGVRRVRAPDHSLWCLGRIDSHSTAKARGPQRITAALAAMPLPTPSRPFTQPHAAARARRHPASERLQDLCHRAARAPPLPEARPCCPPLPFVRPAPCATRALCPRAPSSTPAARRVRTVDCSLQMTSARAMRVGAHPQTEFDPESRDPSIHLLPCSLGLLPNACKSPSACDLPTHTARASSHPVAPATFLSLIENRAHVRTLTRARLASIAAHHYS